MSKRVPHTRKDTWPLPSALLLLLPADTGATLSDGAAAPLIAAEQ